MATLFQIADYAARRRVEAVATPGRSAEIHLFLGVRYERHNDPQDGSSNAIPPSRALAQG